MKTKRGATIPAPLLLLALAAGLSLSCASGRKAPPSVTASTPPPIQWDNAWSRGIVFYEIDPRSFQDSDGDGFGDLPGLLRRLDYLNDGNAATTDDLGIEGICLLSGLLPPRSGGPNPARESAGDPDSATLEDFDRLLQEAHRRGIHVIIDLPSPRDMEELRELEDQASVWLGRGTDGFRLEAPRPSTGGGSDAGEDRSRDSHALLREFSAFVRAAKPQAVPIGANGSDTQTIATYFGSTATIRGGDELPMNLDRPLAEAILDGVITGTADGIVAKVNQIQSVYPSGAGDAPLLANHDMIRVASRCGGNPAMLRVAASILLTLPGSPLLYYGEEIGLQNGEDGAAWTPMPWDGSPGGGFSTSRPWSPFAPGQDTANVSVQESDPASLLSHYRNLIQLRASRPELRTGSIRILSAPEQGRSIFAFLREANGRSVLVIHNLGGAAATAGPFRLPGFYLKRLFNDGCSDEIQVDGAKNWRIPMPPHATGVWRIG